MSKVLYLLLTLLTLKKKSLLLYLIFKIKIKFSLISKYSYKKGYGSQLHEFIIKSYGNDIIFNDDLSVVEILKSANEIVDGKIRLFKCNQVIENIVCNWFAFPEHKIIQPWYEISINNIQGHDVKLTWEPSRFNWMYDLGLAYKVSGDIKYITSASNIFKSWLDNNPYNHSVNWVCAQECSIRALNFLLFVKQVNAELNNDMYDFFKMTVDRVALTLDYSVSQDNNHSITESAAIFILATFLLNSKYFNEQDEKKYQLLLNKGKKILINSVNNLTLDDGGLAMYSTNYQRAVLTVLTLVEYFRRTYSLLEFPEKYLNNCKSLVLSLHDLVDLTNGHAVNLGANDGTLLFFNRIGGYLDYRPSIQVASYFFIGKLIYKDKSVNIALNSLGIDIKDVGYYFEPLPTTNYKNYRCFGITKYKLLTESCFLFVKYPSYDYRPSQCDLFHLDLWVRGINYLRDLGSYSYNDSGFISSELCSISAHNTVCVDNLEPMPRLGRFLLGCWPKTKRLNISSSVWSGEYKSIFGYVHTRDVNIDGGHIFITDTLYNVKHHVTLNFNLPLCNWSLNESGISNDDIAIDIKTSSAMAFNLIDGFESRFYNQLSNILQFKLGVYPINNTVRIETKITIKESK